MRSPAEIEDRVRDIVVAELHRRLARDVLPHLCVHNLRQPLDHRRTILGEPNDSYNRVSAGLDEKGQSLPVIQSIGLCMLGSDDPETWTGTICEEAIDAQRCPYFKFRQARADVYNEFVTDLRNPEWVALNLPAAHQLLWVMRTPLAVEPSVPAWRRVLRWIARLVSGGPSEKSKGALVYLPPLDAFPEQDSARAPARH